MGYFPKKVFPSCKVLKLVVYNRINNRIILTTVQRWGEGGGVLYNRIEFMLFYEVREMGWRGVIFKVIYINIASIPLKALLDQILARRGTL